MIFLTLFLFIPFCCYLVTSVKPNYLDEQEIIRKNTKQAHLMCRQYELKDWNTPKIKKKL